MSRRAPGIAGAATALALAALVAAGTGCRDEPVTLRFVAQVGDEPLACGRTYAVSGASVELLDLRLFVHDVVLVRADGGLVPLRLDEGGGFQTGRVALLDFEDGTRSCRNGSPETRTVVTGTAPRGDYTGVRFRVGVPFEEDHGNPDLAPPPLNLTAMEWSWVAGHTFLRFDVRADGRPFVFHLGSTGCHGTLGHVTGCDRGNRAEVAIGAGAAKESAGAARFSPERSEIVVDVRALIAAELAATRAGAPGDGCMSGPDDPDCTPLFAALGLDPGTGLPLGAGAPPTFRVR